MLNEWINDSLHPWATQPSVYLLVIKSTAVQSSRDSSTTGLWTAKCCTACLKSICSVSISKLAVEFAEQLWLPSPRTPGAAVTINTTVAAQSLNHPLNRRGFQKTHRQAMRKTRQEARAAPDPGRSSKGTALPGPPASPHTLLIPPPGALPVVVAWTSGHSFHCGNPSVPPTLAESSSRSRAQLWH